MGVAEGLYWPQQSRFAKAWFAREERTTANGLRTLAGFLVGLTYNITGSYMTGFVALGALVILGVWPCCSMTAPVTQCRRRNPHLRPRALLLCRVLCILGKVVSDCEPPRLGSDKDVRGRVDGRRIDEGS